MALQTAVNPQTNETVVLVGGQWQKADKIAAHGETGEKAYFVGGQWVTDTGVDKSLPKPPAERGMVGKAADAVGGFLSGVGDAGMTLASGAIAAPVAGALGVGQAVTNVGRRAVGMPITQTAADTVESAEQALTYQPRTRGGGEYVDAITKPLQMLSQGADRAGQVASDVTGSPAIGAAVNTGVNMLPSLIEPGLRGARATGLIKPKPAAAAAGVGAGTKAEAAARAQDYVNTKLGVDIDPATGKPKVDPTTGQPKSTGITWDSLSQQFKDTLTNLAGDSKKLDSLPVEAVKRQALGQSLRVPATTTAAKLTRNASALRNEANVAATDAGKGIRDVDIQLNRDLQANVEGLKKQLGGVGKTRATASDEGTAGAAEEVGRQVQERALRAKETVSKANYNQLYKEARETEPNARVSPQPMYDFVRGDPDVLNPQAIHLDWLRSWLKKAGIEKVGEEEVPAVAQRGSLGETIEPGRGKTVEKVQQRQIKLTELDDLRQKAGEKARAGGPDAYYAKRVLAAIDKSFEDVPAAASKWKAARKAFASHMDEFSDTGAVKRLVGDKTATDNDRSTALEQTWDKSIRTASLEDIDKLKRSLLSGGNAETRLAGKKALRELRQETVNQYLKYITEGTSTNEASEQNITAVKMVNGLKYIGGEAKAQRILGRRAVNELKRIIEFAKIAKTEPSIRNAGSSTLQNVLTFAEKFLAKTGPVTGGLGDVGAGVVRQVGKFREAGEAGRVARDAVLQPTDAATTRVAKEQLSARRRALLRRNAPAFVHGHSLTLRDDAP